MPLARTGGVLTDENDVTNGTLSTVESGNSKSNINDSKGSEGQHEYTFDGTKGWRRFRILRPGRGIFHDVRRRLPYYWSDITDAFTYRIAASTIRMYFVK